MLMLRDAMQSDANIESESVLILLLMLCNTNTSAPWFVKLGTPNGLLLGNNLFGYKIPIIYFI